MQRQFFIVSAGLGTADSLTAQARGVIKRADAVLSTARLAQDLSDVHGGIEICQTGELAARAVACGAACVAVLVSGDAGFFSAARQLSDALAPHGTVCRVEGISSLQALCARVGTSYDDAYLCSLHGRAGSLIGAVSYRKKVFALTGGAQSARQLCAELDGVGLGGVSVSLGENLGAQKERIEVGTASELSQKSCGNLAVLLVENEQAVDPAAPLYDRALTRGDVPMTKQEVRFAALGLLGVRPSDTVWDVGAGTGAVSIALARAAWQGTVFAIEHKEDACALILQNRTALGAYNVRLVDGRAPDVLADLPAPNAVFVGGSGGQLRAVFAQALEKNPAVRLVVSAIALETLHAAQQAMRELGISDVAVCQIAASRGKTVGAYTMLTANNPVFLISGGGKDGA